MKAGYAMLAAMIVAAPTTAQDRRDVRIADGVHAPDSPYASDRSYYTLRNGPRALDHVRDAALPAAETPLDLLADFGRCVVARDPAAGLAYAQMAGDGESPTAVAARRRAAPVLSACTRLVHGPRRRGDEGIRLNRAAIADALRERYSPGATLPPS